MATILILYLATSSSSTGMAVTTAEYGSPAACEEAGKAAKSRFGGWATGVYWSCSPKGGAGPAAPQTR
ncbi:hypothetical protein [Methylobacterium brachiatum]|uniref:hypothetical protein n=1 Tax=Methylobacterium brachiatum TaxID=269660 RepID=UPI0024480E02|nr:hypothetical protein [Methylobacterium brachiatum]MDH2313353.1 hypothetical protein [Methylobacterium brachiatum]